MTEKEILQVYEDKFVKHLESLMENDISHRERLIQNRVYFWQEYRKVYSKRGRCYAYSEATNQWFAGPYKRKGVLIQNRQAIHPLALPKEIQKKLININAYLSDKSHKPVCVYLEP